MPRIHIIGAPGSGKTTYARRLAAARKLPLCHLDEIFHDNSGTAPRKRTESERTEMAAEWHRGNLRAAANRRAYVVLPDPGAPIICIRGIIYPL